MLKPEVPADTEHQNVIGVHGLKALSVAPYAELGLRETYG
jgi:hypothetical protein